MVKEDFEQALLDVKSVSMGSCDLIMMSLSPSGIWCEQRQLDDYISNGELNNSCVCSTYMYHSEEYLVLDTYNIGIIDWSPIVEQILEKGRVAIKQTQHDKYTTLTSLLIYGWLHLIGCLYVI